MTVFQLHGAHVLVHYSWRKIHEGEKTEWTENCNRQKTNSVQPHKDRSTARSLRGELLFLKDLRAVADECNA
jgi:hypothetical protein